MPIAAFSKFTGGLDPNRRSPQHFVTNTTSLEDDPHKVVIDGGVPCEGRSFYLR